MAHVGKPDAFGGHLLVVDGKIGPLSEAALGWAQRVLELPVTGQPDAATTHSLGLS